MLKLNSKGSTTGGLILIFVGIVFLLLHFRVIEWYQLFRWTLWQFVIPVIIIAYGLMILYNR